MKHTRMNKPERSSQCLELAAIFRQNILDPLRSASIRQCNDETLTTPKHEDGRAVLSMGFPSCVHDNAHAGQMLRERPQKMVCDVQIESREPPGCGHLNLL